MRILVINYEYPPLGGGGGLVTRDILEQMAGMGHEPTVITSGFKGLMSHENMNGVNVHRVPILFRRKMEVASIPSMLSYFPSSVLHAIRGLKGKTYDVMNTHFAIPSGPTGYLLSKIFDLPNVLSIHGGDIFDPSKTFSPHKAPLLSTMVKAMLKTADRVVAQSKDTRENAYRYYNVSREISIIPLGIKRVELEEKPRSDFGFSPDEIVFCAIGRLIKRKRFDETIMAISDLNRSARCRLIIIGEGPERMELEGLIRNLGLEEIVRLYGNVSDQEKFQLLSLSDIYLSTSVHEGFGLVFLEAMECGLPIVSYDRGGQNEFLIDGQTGFLVRLGDREVFQRKVAALMADPGLRMEMAAFNKRQVANYYIENCAVQYVSLFHEVISNRRRVRAC